MFDIPSTAGGATEKIDASLIPAAAPNSAPATASAESARPCRSDQSFSSTKLTPALLRWPFVSTSKPVTEMSSSYAGCANTAFSNSASAAFVRWSDAAGGSAAIAIT